MKREFITVLTAISMATWLVAPAFAGGAQDRFKDSSDARAGFYLSIPFAGGLKPASDTHLSYGINLDVGMSFAQNSFMDPRRTFRADILKLSFSTRGYDNLAIGGQKLLGSNAARFGAAEGDGDNKSRDAWGYALLGVGAIALGVVVLGGKGCPPNNTRAGSGGCATFVVD